MTDVHPPQTDPAEAVHRELNPGAPAEAVRGPGQFLHDDVPVDLGEPVQLFLHNLCLEPALCFRRHVLPVTAAALSRSAEGTRRRNPIGRLLKDLYSVRPQESVCVRALGHQSHNALPRERVPYEHRPALVPGHTEAPVGHRAHRHLEPLPDQAAAALTRRRAGVWGGRAGRGTSRHGGSDR